MGRKIFCCFLLAGLLLACRTSETKESDVPVLDWENGLAEAGPLTPTDIEYIPLETKDDCLIGSIDKIIYNDGTYFISDNQQNRIFLFGDKGEHLFTLDKIGKGPGEYIDIWDFDVDKNRNIYVLSFHSNEIIKFFAPSYDQTERFPLKMMVREFAIDTSGQIWIAEAFSQEKTSIILGRYEQGKIIPVLKDTMGLKNRSLHYKQQSFYKFPDGLMFSSRYSPDVYKLENKEAKKVLRFESKKMITKDELEKESDETIAAIPNDRWVFGFETLNMLGDSLYGRVWSMDEFSAFKCNRTTGKGSRYAGITKDLPGMGNFYTHADDYIISPTAATNIIYSLRQLKGMSEEGIARLRATAEQIDEESNPVLIKFRY